MRQIKIRHWISILLLPLAAFYSCNVEEINRGDDTPLPEGITRLTANVGSGLGTTGSDRPGRPVGWLHRHRRPDNRCGLRCRHHRRSQPAGRLRLQPDRLLAGIARQRGHRHLHLFHAALYGQRRGGPRQRFRDVRLDHRRPA